MELEGVVERKHVARGSKAEHDAIGLRVGKRFYWLRTRDGHPYQDPTFVPLIGRRLRGEGSVAGPWFIVDRWQVVDPDESSVQGR